MVIDGSEETSFDGTGQGSLTFSSDSQHLAYAAQSEGRWSVVVDGKQDGDYDGLRELVFSPTANGWPIWPRRVAGNSWSWMIGKVVTTTPSQTFPSARTDGAQPIEHRQESSSLWLKMKRRSSPTRP